VEFISFIKEKKIRHKTMKKIILPIIICIALVSTLVNAAVTFQDNFTRADSATVGGVWTEGGAGTWAIDTNNLYYGGGGGDGEIYLNGHNANGSYDGIKLNTSDMTGFTMYVKDMSASNVFTMKFGSATQILYYNSGWINCGSAFAFAAGDWVFINKSGTGQIIDDRAGVQTNICNISTTYNFAETIGFIQMNTGTSTIKRIGGVCSANLTSDCNPVAASENINLTSVSWLTNGYDTDQGLLYNDVLSLVNVTLTNSAVNAYVQVLYPDGSVAINNATMSNTSSLYSNSSLNLRLDRIGNWTVTIYANKSGVFGNLTTSFNVTLLSNPIEINGYFGYDANDMPNATRMMEMLNYGYNLLGFRMNYSKMSSNWSSLKTLINNTYSYDVKTFLKVYFDKNNYTNYTAECNSINANFTELLNYPYVDGLAFFVIETNETAHGNVTLFANQVAACIKSATNSLFPIYMANNVSNIDNGYVKSWDMVRISDAGVISADLGMENTYMRNTTSLTRVYNGTDSAFMTWTENYYNNVLRQLRDLPSSSGQPTDTRVAKLNNGDRVVFNNNTGNIITVNLSVDYNTDFWNVNKKELQKSLNSIENYVISVEPNLASVLFLENYSKIMMTDNYTATLYKALAGRVDIMNYLQNASTDATLSIVSAYDARAELWNPDYGFNHLMFHTYEQLEYSQIVDFNPYEIIVIAKGTNTPNVVNTSLRVSSFPTLLNRTYGYISVADYNNTNSTGANVTNCSIVNPWELVKTDQITNWTVNYSTNVFIDGFDIGYSSTPSCFNERIKRLGDYIRFITGKKSIFNTYTIYQSIANYGDKMMRESCFSRWAGDVGNPTYTYENMSLMIQNSDFMRINNKPVICMSFGDVNDYDKMAYDYHAFSVMYGLTTGDGQNNTFRYAQPNFQIQREIRVPNFGNQLQNIYDTTSNNDWWRRYSNGIVHFSPYRNYTFNNGKYYWFEDGKTVNNMTIKGHYQIYAASCSGGTNIIATVNDNISATIDACTEIGPNQWNDNWVIKDFTTAYQDNGHYYITFRPASRAEATGTNIYRSAITTAGVHSWWDNTANNPPSTEIGWTSYGRSGTLGDFNTSNYQINITVNKTTSSSIDTNINTISQTVTRCDLGYVVKRNITLSTTKNYSIDIYGMPYFFNTLRVFNTSAYLNDILLNETTTNTCNGSNPTFNTTNPDSLGVCRRIESAGFTYRFKPSYLNMSFSTIIQELNDPPTSPTGLTLTASDLILTATATGGADTEGDTLYYYYEYYNDTGILQAYNLSQTYVTPNPIVNNTISVRAKTQDGYNFSYEYINKSITVNATQIIPGSGGSSGGSAGGGGTSDPEQKTILNTTSLLTEAMIACETKNGTPVNIKGSYYCRIGDSYYPIENMVVSNTINILGFNIPNFGSIVYPSKPSLGWIIIIFVTLLVFGFVKDHREIAKESAIKKIPRKEEEKEYKKRDQNNKGRKRADGGYY
jgi:hypothetical protein